MPDPKLETLFGGREVTILLADGTAATVKVRQLPVKLFPQFHQTIEDEIEQVALYTDRPREWVESLPAAAHDALAEAGWEVNADFFGRWAARRERVAKLAVPDGMQRAIADALLAGMQKDSTSPTSSPKPPSPPA